jgi:tetratricopeptide (TPR) repeat protein
MGTKASIILLYFCTVCSLALAGQTSLEALIQESIQRRDWPEVVLLLEPLRGQNFEHDLELSRAYLALERRTEAIQLLGELLAMGGRPEERAFSIYTTATEAFFNQETSELFTLGLHLFRSGRWSEAKERWDQALQKEPGHALVLLRLIQVESVLGLKSQFLEHYRELQKLPRVHPDLKGFALYQCLSDPRCEDKTLLPLWTSQKGALLLQPLTSIGVFEAALRLQKKNELNEILEKLKSEKPSVGNSFQLKWFVQHYPMLEEKKKELRERILKTQAITVPSKGTPSFWECKILVEELVKNL